MGRNKALYQLLKKGHEQYLPSLSVDCVIFGFHGSQLKVLLLKMKNVPQWALPGGFIRNEEHIDTAATRILRERTGLHDIFLNQFHAFGDPGRSKENLHSIELMKGEGFTVNKNNWLLSRFITVGYYALVEFSVVIPSPDHTSEACGWCDIHEVPGLILDHNHILQKALETLRLQLNHQPIGYSLLPQKFTMPELQKLYETILDKKLDRRNFQRRMLAFGILKKLNQRRIGVAHKSPFLYTFNLSKYHKALKDGLQGGW